MFEPLHRTYFCARAHRQDRFDAIMSHLPRLTPEISGGAELARSDYHRGFPPKLCGAGMMRGLLMQWLCDATGYV